MAYFWFKVAQLHLPDIASCYAFGKLEFINTLLIVIMYLDKEKAGVRGMID